MSFTTQDVRAGSLRHLAHIPEAEFLSVGNPAIAKAAGQNQKTLESGATDAYIGTMSEDTNLLKAKFPYKDPFAPVPAPARNKAPVSAIKINARLYPDDQQLANPKENDKEKINKKAKVSRTIFKKNEAKSFDEAARTPQPPHLLAIIATPNIRTPNVSPLN